MKTSSLVICVLASTLWMACPSQPPPQRPRTEARPADPPAARRTPPPPPPERPPAKARTAAPECVLLSASQEYCLKRVYRTRTRAPSRCRGRWCHHVQWRVVKKDGTVVQKLPPRLGKPMYLDNAGVLTVDPRHSITSPGATVAITYAGGKATLLKASDLLAPSRFLGDVNFRKEWIQHKIRLPLPDGKAVEYDIKAGKVIASDLHCQSLAKKWVVVSRPRFQKTGTFTVGRGSCAKHKIQWSMASDEAPFAVTPNGRRVITRTTSRNFYGQSHVASAYDRKGKAGRLKHRFLLRDLASVKERYAPETCRGYTCRGSVKLTYHPGGKLEMRWRWGTTKTVRLTRASLMKTRRPTWRAGKTQGPIKGLMRVYKGDPRAKVTLLVYGDLQCPFTARLMQALDDLLRAQRRGLKVVWADLPLAFHKRALPAAIVARSVLDQKGAKAYWRFVDRVLTNRRAMHSDQNLLAWAKGLGAKAKRVKQDLSSKRYEPELKASAADARRMGARGTPTLILNGKRLQHHRGFWHIRAQLKPLLGKRLRPVK